MNWQIYPPFKHISLQHHYTKSLTHIEEYTDTHGRPTPCSKHKYVQHHYTEFLTHVAECTDTHGRPTPPLLTIDLWNTTTPHIEKYGHSAI